MQTYMLAGALLAVLMSIALAWKWRLGIGRTFLVVVVLAAISDVVVTVLGNIFVLTGWICAGLVWALTAGAAFLFLIYRFYRDPERKPPDRNDVVVSPADGAVLYIRRSQGGVMPGSTNRRLCSRGPGGRVGPATWGDPPWFAGGSRPACPQ